MTLIHFATPRGLHAHLTIWYDWSCQVSLVGKHQQQNQANTHDIQNYYLPTYPQHNHTPKGCGSLAVVSEKFVAAVEHETTLKSANQTITHIVLPSSPMHTKNQIVFSEFLIKKKGNVKGISHQWAIQRLSYSENCLHQRNPPYRSSDSPWLEGSLRQTGDKHMRQGYIGVENRSSRTVVAVNFSHSCNSKASACGEKFERPQQHNILIQIFKETVLSLPRLQQII